MTIIPFKTVTGTTIKERIKNHAKESDIEYAFRYLLEYMTDRRLLTQTDSFKGTRSMTDGRLTYFIDEHNAIMGLQEAKYKKPRTENELKKALCQALHYNYYKYTQEFIEYDYFFLPTEIGIAYVLRKDIEELIKELDSLFKKTTKCPSMNWSDVEIRTTVQKVHIDFHYHEINSELQLNVVFAEIFNGVISSWKQCV